LQQDLVLNRVQVALLFKPQFSLGLEAIGLPAVALGFELRDLLACISQPLLRFGIEGRRRRQLGG
jgi:hypothetical protein